MTPQRSPTPFSRPSATRRRPSREHHFPDNMPAELRAAHERNDEVLERIYIGRRFKNDTERLEKLFDLYTQMTGAGKMAASTMPKSTPRQAKQALASKT
jgi:hypothetical protein